MVATWVLVACAVLITASVVRRDLIPSGGGRRARNEQPKDSVLSAADWNAVRSKGQVLGPSNAKVQIVVFSDFECPFCAQFARKALSPARSHYRDQIAVIFRHFPLSIHRLARPAAQAAECAAKQSKFWEFHDWVFATADSLGLIPMSELAARAGIPDIKAFETCRTGSESTAIARDLAEARRIGAQGTPTVVINGRLMLGVDSTRLDGLIRDLLTK